MELSTAGRRVYRAVQRQSSGVPLDGPRSDAEDFDDAVRELREKGLVAVMAGVDGLAVLQDAAESPRPTRALERRPRL